VARIVLGLSLALPAPLLAQGAPEVPAARGPLGDWGSAINKPMSPPPTEPGPTDAEPNVRAVREDLHPPVHFLIAPNSEKLDLKLYQERGVNPVLGPGGNQDHSEFVPLCSLPCDMSMRSRSFVFGVSTGRRSAVKVDPVLQLRDNDRVFLHYNSRLPLRITGWILLLAGTAAGGLLLGAGLPAGEPAIPARVASGSVLMAVGLGFGLWFANMPDRATGWVVR
jgi:hypothetical protein